MNLKAKISLNKALQLRLLKAINLDRLTLNQFPELIWNADGESTEEVVTICSVEELERINQLMSRLKINSLVEVPLNRDLKIRLFKAIYGGLIDMAEFPELQDARRKIRLNLSEYSKDEMEFLLEIARRRT